MINKRINKRLIKNNNLSMKSKKNLTRIKRILYYELLKGEQDIIDNNFKPHKEVFSKFENKYR